MGREGGCHYHECMCYIMQRSHQDGGGWPSRQRTWRKYHRRAVSRVARNGAHHKEH